MQIGNIIFGVLFMMLILTGMSMYYQGMATNYGVTVSTSVPAVDNAYGSMNQTITTIMNQTQRATTISDPVTQLYSGLSAMLDTMKLFVVDIPNTMLSLIDGIGGTWLGIPSNILSIIKIIITAIIVIAVVEAVRRWYLQ